MRSVRMVTSSVSRSGLALLASLAVVVEMLAASPAAACGYHSPQALARGILNWSYPKALYVQTAVWQAENTGLLPPRTPGQRDLFAYQKTIARLEMLGARLSVAEGHVERVSFAAVLLESMLWVRFAATAEGYVVSPHVDGPEKGDLVIVTHGKVIQALSEGALAAADAEKHGLLRFYGPEAAQEQVRMGLSSASAALNARPTAVTKRQRVLP
jgi:hypothetical protein